MNTLEREERIQNIIKYGKYVVLIVIIGIIALIIINSKQSYSKIEKTLIEAAQKYVADNKIQVNDTTYIEITKLGEIEGTELCSKASGVSVTNENGKFKYKAFLSCNNYQSKVSTANTKYIILTGGDVITLNKGEVFNDPLYTLKKEAEVIISGKVLTTPGIYTISYAAYVDNELKETVYRKVIVSESDKASNISGLVNEVDPIITLLGDKNMTISLNSRYKEPGYKAMDYVDGKISRSVDVTGKVNTSQVGTYPITYKVTNSRGRTAIVQRFVKIIKETSNLNISLSQNNEEVSATTELNLEIIGEDYSYTIIPDGTKCIMKNCSYIVKNNGTYTFKIYDIRGNEFIKEIEVSNIDNTPPAGSCSALIRGNNTEVGVNASDNKGIASYTYILDGVETSKSSDNTYKVSKKSSKVTVKVTDIAGNEANLTCSVTVKEETIVPVRTSGSTSVKDVDEYLVVDTKNDVISLANYVEGRVSQNTPPGYPDMCLSFAYYHAYKLYNGDPLSSMTAVEGAKYHYGSFFTGVKNDSKQEILKVVYEQIKQGRPCILHVNGNTSGTSRHYVTVVGYKKTVTSGETMSETDLLIIDSYDGKLERMDKEGSRFMISGYDTGRKGAKAYGYQVYILK